MEEVLEALAAHAHRPDVVGRITRLGVILWLNLVPALMLLPGVARAIEYLTSPERIESEFVERYVQDADIQQQVEARRDAARMILAHLYRGAYGGGQGVAFGDLSAGTREALREAARQYPRTDRSRLHEARAVIGNPAGTYGGYFTLAYTFQKGAAVYTAFGLLALPAAFLLRGGLSYSMLGIRLVDERGRRVGRVRCLLRALVAWSPCLALVPGLVWTATPVLWGLRAVGFLALLAGATYSVYSPERGIPDHVVGTWAVRR